MENKQILTERRRRWRRDSLVYLLSLFGLSLTITLMVPLAGRLLVFLDPSFPLADSFLGSGYVNILRTMLPIHFAVMVPPVLLQLLRMPRAADLEFEAAFNQALAQTDNTKT